MEIQNLLITMEGTEDARVKSGMYLLRCDWGAKTIVVRVDTGACWQTGRYEGNWGFESGT